MDVDNPQIEEAMETDPPLTSTLDDIPQLTRKDSVLDTDGDEVMQDDIEEGEGMYEDIEEGGIETFEGDGEGYDETEDIPIEESESAEGVTVGGIQEVELDDGHEEAGGEEINGETVITAPHDISTTAHAGSAEESKEENAETAEIPQETSALTSSPLPQTPQVETITPVEQSKSIPKETDEDTEAEHAIEHAEQDEHLGGDEDEEEGAEEEYDLLTPSTLPPIILNLPNSRRALFNPITSDDGTSLPLWFAERMEELCEGTLAQMWAAIRSNVDQEGEGNDDEMVIIEKLTDLKMGDSDVNLEDISFLDLVQMYHDCELPQPMELFLEFHPHRFITRFNAIQKELEAREVVYMEDEDEEEEEGPFEGTETHQKTVPLPAPQVDQGQGPEYSQQADEPLSADAAHILETEADEADIEANQPVINAEAKPLPPTADEIADTNAESGTASESLDTAEREESLVGAESPAIGASGDVGQTADEGHTTAGDESVSAKQGVAQDAPITSTDPLPQPAGAAELSDAPTRGDENPIPPVDSTEEQSAVNTIPETVDDRAGVDIDTTEGQAQAIPIGGEAAVYEPAGDEDDDLIEGGEEYEEGDYDDELVDEVGEGEVGEGAVEGAEGEDGEEVYDDQAGEGEDNDPYGVDSYVEGVIGGNEEYDPEAEAEAEVYEAEAEAEEAELAPDATVDPHPDQDQDHVENHTNGNGNVEVGKGKAIDADDELGIQHPDEEELVGDGEDDVEDAATGAGGEGDAAGEGGLEISPPKRARSASVHIEDEEVVGKRVKMDGELE